MTETWGCEQFRDMLVGPPYYVDQEETDLPFSIKVAGSAIKETSDGSQLFECDSEDCDSVYVIWLYIWSRFVTNYVILIWLSLLIYSNFIVTYIYNYYKSKWSLSSSHAETAIEESPEEHVIPQLRVYQSRRHYALG